MTDSSTATPRAFWLLLPIALAICYAPRFDHYRGWMDDPSKHFAGPVVAANADAYHWFRGARDLYQGRWIAGERDPLRRHPDGAIRAEPPWIVRVLAWLARFTGGDVYRAGLWFSLATSCLFVLPLCFYAARVGWPAAGLLAGMLGAAGESVFVRTAIFRVDTDSVNLFGLWWLAFLFALPSSPRNAARAAVLAALAGVSAGLFIAWYNRPGFLLVFAATFLACLLARGFPLRRAALLAGLFLLLANPLQLTASVTHLAQVARVYTAHVAALDSGERTSRSGSEAQTVAGPGALDFEGLSTQIQELDRLPPARSLALILEPPWLAAIGVATFAAWAAWRWRLALPLAPLAVLGLMGLVVARRFLFFLAPLAGLGLGIALTLLVRIALRRSPLARYSESVACVLAFATFAALLPGTYYDQRPRPPRDGPLLQSLRRAATLLPEGSVVWHSWGSGYLVQDVLGAATFTDGGRADPVVVHLASRGLTSDSPAELQRILALLHSEPRRRLHDAFRGGYAEAEAGLRGGYAAVDGDLFLLLTRSSLRLYGAYYHHGQWRPETGWPEPEIVVDLRCRPRGPDRLLCGGRKVRRPFRIDLESGTIDGRPELSRVISLRKGRAVGARRYPDGGDRILLLAATPGRNQETGYLMSRRAFDSNLVQLYALARFDPKAFELVYDDYPESRLYRVRGVREEPQAASNSEAKP